MKKMQKFLLAKLANCELNEQQLDTLTDMAYPHDGTSKGMLAASRVLEAEFGAFSLNGEEQKQHKVTPMTDAELEEIAKLF